MLPFLCSHQFVATGAASRASTFSLGDAEEQDELVSGNSSPQTMPLKRKALSYPSPQSRQPTQLRRTDDGAQPVPSVAHNRATPHRILTAPPRRITNKRPSLGQAVSGPSNLNTGHDLPLSAPTQQSSTLSVDRVGAHRLQTKNSFARQPRITRSVTPDFPDSISQSLPRASQASVTKPQLGM